MGASVCFLGFPEDVMSCVLLGVVVLASVALLGCVLARYVSAWRDTDACDSERAHAGNHGACGSLFMSNWFFVLDASLCLLSLLGLIVCL